MKKEQILSLKKVQKKKKASFQFIQPNQNGIFLGEFCFFLTVAKKKKVGGGLAILTPSYTQVVQQC